MPTFMPPTEPYAQFDENKPYGIAYKLMRYFGTLDRGRNVFLLKNGTITETDPDSQTVLWSDVDTVWWGSAAEPYVVTSAQAALLTAAGYTVEA